MIDSENTPSKSELDWNGPDADSISFGSAQVHLHRTVK